ncbi:MAG: VIT and vWA domain-containing protein [Bacteroidales bacterium]
MRHNIFIPTLLVLLLAASFAAAQQGETTDKTLSPYFFVKGSETDVDHFPLKSTSAQVDITGVIARVTVSQVYANEGTRPLEAIYIFPGSTRAAVHGMKMTIGERTITAQIEERQEARRQYAAARDAGKTASLLEQQRPNVFQMNVANILPRDEVRVELTYTELLVPEAGVYEFVYPTVVGPRYARAAAGDTPDAATWTRNPYLRKGTKPATTFDFRARVATGIALKELASPSHKMTIDFVAKDRAQVALAAAETHAANRDVVLRYRLAGDRIESGLLLSTGTDENFFVCMLEPPKRVVPASVPPREYVFVMDVSGSMHGFPLEVSKRVLQRVLATLRPIDYFNVVFFSGGSFVLSPTSLPATEFNKERGLRDIERQQGGGGTELLPALRRAVGLDRPRPDIARVVVIATDGYVNVEREAFTLIRGHLGDASIFTFGIGSAVNRHLIEGMARVGKGLPFVVLDQGEAEAAATRFVDYIDAPLLTQVDVRFNGFAAYDLEPASVPDLFADRPIVITGKFRGSPSGDVTITGFTGNGRFERTLKVMREQKDPSGDVLKYLWARERVALLSDYASVGGAEEGKAEVTKLGLRYGLLTPFTSFVAIDQHARRGDGKIETVKQPLPLPAGVSELAVGNSVAVSGMMPAAAPQAAGAAYKMSMSVAESVSGRADEPKPRVVDATPNAPTVPAQRATALQLVVTENRLAGTPAVASSVLQAAIARARSACETCAGRPAMAANANVPMRFTVVFAGGREPARVELLDPERWTQLSSVVGCIRNALSRALILPSPTTGYLVLSIR